MSATAVANRKTYRGDIGGDRRRDGRGSLRRGVRRGHRSLRRHLRTHDRPARTVRAQSRTGHPDLGSWVHRRSGGAATEGVRPIVGLMTVDFFGVVAAKDEHISVIRLRTLRCCSTPTDVGRARVIGSTSLTWGIYSATTGGSGEPSRVPSMPCRQRSPIFALALMSSERPSRPRPGRVGAVSERGSESVSAGTSYRRRSTSDGLRDIRRKPQA